MSYTSGSHTVFHHRYHIVWITKYRYKVLEGALRERIRTIIRQVCKELGVQIVSGVLSREQVHMFVEISPHIAVSDFVRRVKGRSSHRVQMEFPDLRKRYWDGISGLGATSPPLPASAGRYSVLDRYAHSLQRVALTADVNTQNNSLLLVFLSFEQLADPTAVCAGVVNDLACRSLDRLADNVDAGLLIGFSTSRRRLVLTLERPNPQHRRTQHDRDGDRLRKT